MATEIKKVLTIDTTSLKEYKKHISDLRGELLVLEKGSEDYIKIEEEIQRETTKLSEVLKAGKKDVTAVEGSYAALNRELVESRKKFKQLSEEERNSAQGKELIKHIGELDSQLKNLDSQMGQNFRNVGDYSNQFQSAFKSMGGSMKGMIPTIGSLGNALKLLAANPIGAVLTVVSVVLTAIIKSMKNSETQMNALKVALAPLNAAFQAFGKVLTLIGEQIVKVFENVSKFIGGLTQKLESFARSKGWTKIADTIQQVNNLAKENIEISKAEIKLEQDKRDAKKKTADLDLEISELRVKIADKEKYSTKERLALVNEWEQKERERLELELKIAQDEYDLIVRKNQLSENSAKDNDAEVEAYANLRKTQQSYNDGLRTLIKTKNTLLGQSEKETEDTKEQTEATEDLTEALKKEREELEKLNAERLKNDEKNLERQFERQKYWSLLGLEDKKKRAELEYDIERQLIEDKIALQQSFLDTQTLSEQKRLEILQTIADEEEKLLRLGAEYRLKTQQQITQDEAEETKKREKLKQQELQAAQMTTQGLGDVFNQLAELSEEGSEQQKQFAIMGTTISTLSAAVFSMMSVWKSELPFWGKVAMSVLIPAQTIASGVAQIQKIKQTTKGNSGLSGGSSLSGSRGNTSMIGVAPLLNENRDLENLQSIPLTRESDGQKDVRVWVLESDITDSQRSYRTKVSESSF